MTEGTLVEWLVADGASVAPGDPLYRIEKRPKMRARQGMYAVVGMDGQILRRGHDLTQVLRVLEKKLIRPID